MQLVLLKMFKNYITLSVNDENLVVSGVESTRSVLFFPPEVIMEWIQAQFFSPVATNFAID